MELKRHRPVSRLETPRRPVDQAAVEFLHYMGAGIPPAQRGLLHIANILRPAEIRSSRPRIVPRPPERTALSASQLIVRTSSRLFRTQRSYDHREQLHESLRARLGRQRLRHDALLSVSVTHAQRLHTQQLQQDRNGLGRPDQLDRPGNRRHGRNARRRHFQIPSTLLRLKS